MDGTGGWRVKQSAENTDQCPVNVNTGGTQKAVIVYFQVNSYCLLGLQNTIKISRWTVFSLLTFRRIRAMVGLEPRIYWVYSAIIDIK